MTNRPPTPQCGTRAARRRVGLGLTLASALFILAACGGGAPTATPSPTQLATPQATATRAATPTLPATPTLGTPATSGTPAGTPAGTPGGAMNYPEMVKRAIAQLAKDSGVPETQIEVVSYEQTEWSDSSLGCPKPGQAYLTVITPGYRVILRAAGQLYEYHTNEKNMAIRCPQ